MPIVWARIKETIYLYKGTLLKERPRPTVHRLESVLLFDMMHKLCTFVGSTMKTEPRRAVEYKLSSICVKYQE